MVWIHPGKLTAGALQSTHLKRKVILTNLHFWVQNVNFPNPYATQTQKQLKHQQGRDPEPASCWKTVATNLVMTFSIKRLLSCLWREEMFLKWHGHDVESHNMLSVSSTAAPSISSIGALYRMNMKISRAKTSHSSDCEQGSQWTIQTKWKH